jgi:hypothetical protein
MDGDEVTILAAQKDVRVITAIHRSVVALYAPPL